MSGSKAKATRVVITQVLNAGIAQGVIGMRDGLFQGSSAVSEWRPSIPRYPNWMPQPPDSRTPRRCGQGVRVRPFLRAVEQPIPLI